MSSVYPPSSADSSSSDEESFELIDEPSLVDDEMTSQSNDAAEKEENRGENRRVEKVNSRLAFSDQIQLESDGYFEMIYDQAELMTVTGLLEKLKTFQMSSDAKEKQMLQCIVQNLLADFPFYKDYPERERRITAELYGGIIREGILQNAQIVEAFRNLEECLKEDPSSTAWLFATVALDACKWALHKHPQECAKIDAVPDFNQLPDSIKEFIYFGLLCQIPPAPRVHPQPTEDYSSSDEGSIEMIDEISFTERDHQVIEHSNGEVSIDTMEDIPSEKGEKEPKGGEEEMKPVESALGDTKWKEEEKKWREEENKWNEEKKKWEEEEKKWKECVLKSTEEDKIWKENVVRSKEEEKLMMEEEVRIMEEELKNERKKREYLESQCNLAAFKLSIERDEKELNEKTVREAIDCAIRKLNEAGVDNIYPLDKRDVGSILVDMTIGVTQLVGRLNASRQLLKAFRSHSKPATRTVTLSKSSNDLFGFTHLGFSISGVNEGGSAEKSGVKKGDQIVSIDGVNVEKLSWEELRMVLDNAKDSMKMELRHNPERLKGAQGCYETNRAFIESCECSMLAEARKQREELANENEELKSRLEEMKEQIESLKVNPTHSEPVGEIRTVTLGKGADGLLGIRRVGCSINKVYEGTPAALNGLQRGDEILSIDGVEIATLAREDIKFLLRRPSPTITLVVRHNPERLKTHMVAKSKLMMMGLEDTSPLVVVQLNTGEDGLFGLTHIGTSISNVRERGAAERCGVKRGDQLVALDGHNVETSSEEEISAMFERGRVNGGISLVLRHNPERLRDLERY